MGGPYCGGGMPPSASVGNRTLEVALKLYSNATMPNNVHYLMVRFFDANTNQTLQHVSFFLNITENNYSELHDTFNAPTGILMLQVTTISTPFNGTVIGDQEPILHAWTPHDSKPIIVYSPVFNNVNSTYHLKITLDSIDRDNNLFDESTAPQFDSHLNLKEQNVTKFVMSTMLSKVDPVVLQKLHLINLSGGDLHLLADVKLEDYSYVSRLPSDITIVYSKNNTVGMAVDNGQISELSGLDFVKQITSPNGVFPRDSNATVENPPSPLAQYRAGIVPIYVKCKQGFGPVLMQSSIDNNAKSSPACFTWDDEIKIQNRGIGKIVNNSVKTKYWDLYGLLPSRMSFSMEPNSSGQIIVKYFPYFNNNMTRHVKPQVFSGYDSNSSPILTSNITVSANPDAITDNKGQNTTVTYTVNTSNVKGLYWIYIPINGCNDMYPLLVGLGTNNVSTTDIAMYVGRESCPSIDMGGQVEDTRGISTKQMLAAPIFN